MTRLDIAVREKIGGISRAAASKLIAGNYVRVNNRPVTKAALSVSDEDKITVDYDFKAKPSPKNLKIKVIYEDDDCLVINKPVGVLTHSKGDFNPEATVATWLTKYYTGPKSERAGIVHRLDRATSGVMICAKNEAATKWLQKQFAERKVKKGYTAVINGQLNPLKALIDLPIERNPKRPQTFRVGVNGKSAQTEYDVIKANDKLSLIELWPTTGRTHQLRVHLAHIGHPILGDHLYGGKAADRLYLHANILTIKLPSKELKTFEVPVPKEFKQVINGSAAD